MDEIQTCLRCDGELEHGAIVGQSIFINWLPEGEEEGLTMLGGEHLARGTANRGPRIRAARCQSCGLGFFESGNRAPA